jgi:hypothetical protein
MFFILPQGEGFYSLRDVLEDNWRTQRPVQPYGPISITPFGFFNADFRYLDKKDNKQNDLFDPLKRIHCGENWMFSFGGEERLRWENLTDYRLTGRDNSYLLYRTRLLGDLWYRDQFRIYAEYIDAAISFQDLPPQLVDQNRSDFLNLFFDLKICEWGDAPVYVRGGRQELLFGSERLISPLDWVNTRRTFEGVRLFRHSDQFDADFFWVQPVIPNRAHFDSVDWKANFSGAWFAYRPAKGRVLDWYYLNLDGARPVAAGEGGVLGAYNVNTIGSRYHGDCHNVLWDVEGMYQFGSWSSQSISAGAYTVELGYNWADWSMTPQFWIGYDWASGDWHPGQTGTHGTFNQLFPFAHPYFGYLDLVGRQNINDFNMQLAMFPTKWIITWLQFHIFRLDSDKDALYAANGARLRQDPTGRAGGEVGNELDFATNFHLSAHQDLLIGYSKLFAGSFIRQTGNPGSPELFYIQYSFKW